ncbi:MAG: T9SS sorting signal type C domain-containing protein [Xanthomarina sp.]
MTLELDMYFSRYRLAVPEHVYIEASTDGGDSWLNRIATIDNNMGHGTNFEHVSYNLDAYAGEANLRIRVYYYSEWGDGVAIDNIKLYGNTTLNPESTWAIPPGLNAYTDAAGSTTYTGDYRSSIYVVPTAAALETSATWSFLSTVTLANGCMASGTVIIENNTKYFKGSDTSYTNWNDSNNWKPNGIPTADNCVIIPDSYTSIIDASTHGNAQNISVQNGGTLKIKPEGNLTLVNFSEVEPTGNFIIESGGSLVQIDNVTNTGHIKMQRMVNNMLPLDYVYWSSPVTDFPVTLISPGTNTNLIWHWIPTVPTNGIGHYGTWRNTSENMLAGKGYIVRGISGTNPEGVAALNTVQFTGVPRNGNIQIPIYRGTYTGGNYMGAGNTQATSLDDNWNLVGNPYPSAISAEAFIAENAGHLNLILGTVYLWTHASAPSTIDSPFYEDFQYNYNPNDYIGYNYTGPNPPSSFDNNIASGQAFFVFMNDGAATGSNLLFNNSMRYNTGLTPYNNTEFFRTSQNSTNQANSGNLEKHRIWLDLIAPNNRANSILIGYIENATNGLDKLFDGFDLSGTDTKFYSLIAENKLSIQGKALPFMATDLVPLGLLIPQAGNYIIAINSVDGLFQSSNQDIFLEDSFTGMTHNLRSSPYSFNSDTGTFNNRFTLRYTNDTLSMEDENMLKDLVISAPKNSYIQITSGMETIKSVTIYDVLGRTLFHNQNLNQSKFTINDVSDSQGVFIVKVTLSNGLQKTQKVVLK